MIKIKKKSALLVFFSGKSNAGGAERMVQYLESYLLSRGVQTEIVDEALLLNTVTGRLYRRLFKYRHFAKRKAVYMARFTSAYLWWRKRADRLVISNGESAPFFPVDIVLCNGCYHAMELDYGRKDDRLSRIAKLQRRACLNAGHIIAVSQKVYDDLIKWYGIQAQKISIVTNRVDGNYFKPAPATSQDRKTVAYIGRLEPGKGLDDVMKLATVIDRSEDWQLLIACNNDSNAALFSGFEHTKVIVGLDFYNVGALAYNKADVVFYPSKSESFGMVTIEALSAGVPVLGTPVGIIPDLVDKKMPGVYVLQPFEGDEILDQLNTAVSEFGEVDRAELHKRIANEFGLSAYFDRMDEVFNSLNLLEHA